MKNSTVIAQTKKGHRVFLENVGRIGQRYTVQYVGASIHVVFAQDGKRAVVASKGGVIDLESKAVTQWAQGATRACVEQIGGIITITRD